MKVVVFGGTGLVGRKLIAYLLDNGHEVMIVSRNINKSKNIFSYEVSHIEWDYFTNLIPAGMEDADCIINLAGVSIADKRWNQKTKDAILKSRINATRAIVQSMKQKIINPKILINASAVGYYGDRGDEALTEESAPGDDFLANVCKKWEMEALEAQELGVRVVLIRTGIVLGDGGVLDKITLPYKFFMGGTLGSGKQWFSWVQEDDLAKIYLYCLENESVSGPVNATSLEPLTMKELNKVLGNVLKKPSFLFIPGFLIRLVMGEMADVVLKGQRALPQKITRLGFEYKYPQIKKALEEIIQKKN
ncbi:hypothetical protein SAMN00017405_1036 [Desulfonispora thiosulfatigenes DSM 11270]|uniref:TIGR01777 family protein n=1 Tax=Desulfonispora thiosulfatigenes DSM 11270 TaxID=656914 RepID=A0A1W1UQW9_DESTI|nr:TIGR01777 family oxidoreductase [Desulfonispora thiosulfatigenes]SMB83409.1 hypothetical protein SAMN00017405_1036 [Desulfonispora thiosulfatigenes DSM 11270]